MGNRKYAYFGEQVQKLVDGLVLEQRWTKAQAVDEIVQHAGYAESTIYRWGQGRLLPPPDTVKILAEIGRHKADLDREWGMRLFEAADYSHTEQAVIDLWGVTELRHIPNNLPRPEHTVFIGRQTELKRLLELLAPDHAAPLISIDGIGGVGKTTLALEAAHKCLRVSTGVEIASHVPLFDAIVFVSAKQEFLTAYGTLPRQQTHRTLRDIYHEIAHTLDRPEITRTMPEAQLGLVHRALAKQRTLLIVDNLETMLDQQEIVAFLYDLPVSVKAVITTRERAIFAPIRLSQLPEKEGLLLIQHEAETKMVALETEQARQLYQRTGGVPAAIVYAVGQLAAGYSVAGVLNLLKDHEGDVAQFCFESSVAPLRGRPAHHFLLAMAMFPKRPLREAVIHVAGLSAEPIAAEEGSTRLQQLSLISGQEGRYQMLPLTREYGLAELAADPDFEKQARERWIQWYLEFAEKFGGDDWAEWHIKFDHLEEEWRNLLMVFDWCRSQDRYSEINSFWQDNKRTVKNFANIYGYWDDRIYWLSWLLEAAERRGDWTTFVGVSPDLAFNLTWLGRPELIEKAKTILTRAWNLRNHADSKTRSYIAEVFAAISTLREKDYDEGYKWLDLAQTEFCEDEYDEEDRVRRSIHLHYYGGVMRYETGLYREAKEFFQQVVELSRAINWQRAGSYAQNYLADIAIEEGNFAEAESLLQSGLPVTERNKDKRRIAFYKYSYARLELKRHELVKAYHWAEQALDDFDRLGMQPEVEKTQQLFHE